MEDKLVRCGGEAHKIPLSEVDADEHGNAIHGNHYFPSGLPRVIKDPVGPYRMVDFLTSGLPSKAGESLRVALRNEIDEGRAHYLTDMGLDMSAKEEEVGDE
ncbi:MAG: hypothetical protein M9953_11080 [Thermomicrobiales bacterium]|nr:hypothetical protein [Thermomicrobiales bacterium]MCO5225870.1 hypothetical protein [Thermomicrobiales bacterium]